MPNTTQNHIPTIVYVEDNAGDAALLEEALRERGHACQLVVIDHGNKAMHYFQMKETARDLPPPHCILLDSLLPAVTGGELLRFLRGSEVYDDTPVYIFSAEREYAQLIAANILSKESFLTKATDWDGLLQLADLLMRSATAKEDQTPANPTDSNPEAHAEGVLRRHDTKDQRLRAQAGPQSP